MTLDLWGPFMAASALLLVIPGPTVFLVMSHALREGRRIAVTMAFGVALGDLVAMSASLAGLGALVLTSATLFSVLKWIGAGYLLWLGIRLWRHPPMPDMAAGANRESGRAVFVHAALVTALNPKSITFFIAFVPQFLRPHAPLAPQFGVMIASFVSLAALNALGYALLAAHLRQRIGQPHIVHAMGRIGGGALIGMSALTALSRRS